MTSCGRPDGSTTEISASATSDTDDPVLDNNTDSVIVTIANAAPVITEVSTSVTQLWPANHKMVDSRPEGRVGEG